MTACISECRCRLALHAPFCREVFFSQLPTPGSSGWMGFGTGYFRRAKPHPPTGSRYRQLKKTNTCLQTLGPAEGWVDMAHAVAPQKGTR